MAHFAELDENNLVIRVVVLHNNELLENGIESEAKGINFCQNLFGGNWIQTSYNHKMRKQFAGIGYKYNEIADVFIAPQPYQSWLLDENYDWQPPTPRPNEAFWRWNELEGTWDETLAE